MATSSAIPEWDIVERQAAAQPHDAHLLDPQRKCGGDRIGRGHHAIGVLVTLVDDKSIKTQGVGIDELIDIPMIDLRAPLRVKRLWEHVTQAVPYRSVKFSGGWGRGMR